MATDSLFSLTGKNVLVTGGTRGIGRAISRRFARAGASVISVYVRGTDAAESLVAEAEGEGLSIQCLQADLQRPSGAEKIEEALKENGWGLSSLIHCAATGVHKRADEFTPRDLKWVFSLNFDAYVTLVSRLLDFMEPGATILAISSKGGSKAVPYYGLVGASKGALESYSRQLAMELADQRIRVNILTPGVVRTDAWDVLPDGEKRLAEAEARTPLGKLVTPDEVAWTAQFLCSQASSGITGQNVIVDGGTEILE